MAALPCKNRWIAQRVIMLGLTKHTPTLCIGYTEASDKLSKITIAANGCSSLVKQVDGTKGNHARLD